MQKYWSLLNTKQAEVWKHGEIINDKQARLEIRATRDPISQSIPLTFDAEFSTRSRHNGVPHLTVTACVCVGGSNHDNLGKDRLSIHPPSNYSPTHPFVSSIQLPPVVLPHTFSHLFLPHTPFHTLTTSPLNVFSERVTWYAFLSKIGALSLISKTEISTLVLLLRLGSPWSEA